LSDEVRDALRRRTAQDLQALLRCVLDLAI
jgi:hypothetical protein